MSECGNTSLDSVQQCSPHSRKNNKINAQVRALTDFGDKMDASRSIDDFLNWGNFYGLQGLTNLICVIVT